jgi:lysophospholipase L1-like esterase/phosphoribosylcarboxyaminoimidazole (NCAIR) mutase
MFTPPAFSDPAHKAMIDKRLFARMHADAARSIRATCRTLMLLSALCVPAWAVDPGNWVSTWTASPQPVWDAGFAFDTKLPGELKDQTLRQVARISLGGARLRIVISNEYGKQPMSIGAAHIALSSGGGAIIAGTDRTVTFGGQVSATVPPGAPLLSDPIDLPTAALASLAISIHLPDPTPVATFHWEGGQTAWLAAGNQVAAERVDTSNPTTARMLVSAVQVEAPARAGAVVVLGDSITDGNGVTVDADARWPDYLAARLAPRNMAVVNAGISGARLLSDLMGVNALARFDRDVLGQPGVRSVIVLLGINDISWPGTAFDRQGAAPSAEALIAGYRQLIARAHARGVRILGATLPPFDGALVGTPLDDYYQPQKDALRQQINLWIRTSGEFDAVIDVDSALKDPAQPARLLPEFDSGDHLHPGDRGNAAMADAVDLDLLR